MTRVVACGSRTWVDYGLILEVLKALQASYAPLRVAQGGAKGADTLVAQACAEMGVDCHLYPADWDTYGTRAGLVRNDHMIHMEQPDLLVAFWDGESHGTAHAIGIAEGMGIPTLVVRPGDTLETVCSKM